MLTDEEISDFMKQALSRTGADEMITPREIIRDYLTLLNILRDNKDASFAELIGKLKFTRVTDTDTEVAPSPRGTANKVNLFDIEI